MYQQLTWYERTYLNVNTTIYKDFYNHSIFFHIYNNICIQIVSNQKEILVLLYYIIQENIKNYSAYLWIFTSCQHILSRSWSTLIYCDLPWWDGIFSTCILHTISLVLLLFVLIFLGHQKWISMWRGSHSKILIFNFIIFSLFVMLNYNWTSLG